MMYLVWRSGQSNSSVDGLFIGFLTTRLGLSNFWRGEVWRAVKGLPSLVFICWMIGGF